MPEDTQRERHIRVAREVLRKNRWELTKPDDPLFLEAVEERLGKRHPKRPNGDHEIPDDSIRRADQWAIVERQLPRPLRATLQCGGQLHTTTVDAGRGLFTGVPRSTDPFASRFGY